MIVALCSTGTALNADLDSRFGRCSYFLFYNTDDSTFHAVENEARHAEGGAGSRAVQEIADNRAEAVIAPELGPQAMDALNRLGIPAFRQGKTLNADTVIKEWQDGKLERQEKASVQEMHRA